MNVDIIKNEIEKNIGGEVRIKVNGLRNKTNIYIKNAREKNIGTSTSRNIKITKIYEKRT